MTPQREGPLAHVVLVEPEIPNNTGNIGRTCVALGAALHLVHPLGFDIDEKACRRAGLDYWPRLSLHEHDDIAAFGEHLAARNGRGQAWALTTKATRSIYDVPLARGDYLVFGRESAGLAPEVRDGFGDRQVRLPMVPGERSLNLATSVGAALFEVARRAQEAGDVAIDARGDLRL